ncbi:IS3 family transposase [Hymenobacter caeli]|uniref:Transposase InsO family protein n=1 Tax=Hymenobacter caeli TaxID=2735894 RepID=A0ABX2FTW7_9BACT|nr:IS3 family transposase [Hymenobacter caeli]NRT20456.1 transposase InsO family protein [Hymenobacter caeli]
MRPTEVGSEEVARNPEVRALRACLERAERGAGSLKKSPGHLRPADPVSTYQHLAHRAAHVPVRQRCQVLQVAAQRVLGPARALDRSVPEPAWEMAVRAALAHHAQCCGTRRLRAQPPRSFVPRTTDPDPAVRAAPDRLPGQPAPAAPNRVWAGDRTYSPRPGGGGCYLAVWLDRCARKIVGGDVRDTMPEALVGAALRRALAVRRPPAGLVVHPDQGSPYPATRFQALLARQGAVPSRSRRGNGYDNAPAESFWSRSKAELLDGGRFPGPAEAKRKIGHRIAYHNAGRRHPALGYQSPNHFETHLQTVSQLCPA